MNYLYLWINIASISIPFLFSFHPKLQFYKKWKGLFLGIIIMMLIFIPWDIIFTKQGFWGFNENYLLGIKLLNLPLEEWLFFICIPYACLFTHYSLLHFFPKLALSKKTTSILFVILQSILLTTVLFQYQRWYTSVNFILASLILGWTYNYNREILSKFFPTFLIILIPFFIVNGILTGSWIENEIVWYRASENLGIRLGTIPIEDTIYALGMLLLVLLITERFSKKENQRINN